MAAGVAEFRGAVAGKGAGILRFGGRCGRRVTTPGLRAVLRRVSVPCGHGILLCGGGSGWRVTAPGFRHPAVWRRWVPCDHTWVTGFRSVAAAVAAV